MHRSKRFALVLVTLAMFAAILPVSAQEADSADSTAGTSYVWALVGDEASTAADIETAAASIDGVVEATSTIQGFDFDSIVRIEVEGTDNEAIAARLSDALGVVVAPGTTELTVSQDPIQGEQWALQPPDSGGIEVDSAWNRSRGDGVIVAVADSGIDPSHPDIADITLVAPWDFIENDDDPQETIGHGTSVSSLVAAPENGVGMVGAAPEAQIMPLRVCPDRSCDFNAVLEAVAYAGENDADIVNLSLGGAAPEGHPDAVVIDDAIGEVVAEHDVLVIAAAGNGQESTEDFELIPAEGPNVLGVASSSQDGTFTEEFASAPGFGSAFGPGIALAAPGDDVITADAASGEWSRGAGTSFSTPLVSGVAALIEGANDRANNEVSSYLTLTVHEDDSLEGRVDTAGIVNARYSVWASKFTDILETVFIEDIAWIAEQGVTIGCNPPDNDLYCTDWEVEREEMASFIARALDLPAASQDYFTDDDGSVHEDDINAIREAGISYGCNAPENTLYCPTDVVTRGQMAAFLSRAFGWEEGANEPAFNDHQDSIFYEDINKMAHEGVTIGCNPPANDEFCVNDGVIRGEMAAFLRRAITQADG